MGHLSYSEIVKEMTTPTERSIGKETSIMSLPIARHAVRSDHVMPVTRIHR
jgi:hypothetical protein